MLTPPHQTAMARLRAAGWRKRVFEHRQRQARDAPEAIIIGEKERAAEQQSCGCVDGIRRFDIQRRAQGGCALQHFKADRQQLNLC